MVYGVHVLFGISCCFPSKCRSETGFIHGFGKSLVDLWAAIWMNDSKGQVTALLLILLDYGSIAHIVKGDNN